MSQTTIPSDIAVPTPVKRPDPLQATKAALMLLLKAKGIDTVIASYCGSSDEGSIELVCAFTADNKPVDLKGDRVIAVGEGDDKRTFTSLEALLEDFAWDCVCKHHDGFENNDGGRGDVNINVPSGRVWIEHNDYYTESEYTETEI
jgi:hypothetical protein